MTDGIPTPARYFAVLSISAGSLLLMIDASIASVALPTISEALHVPASQTVLVLTLYQLVLAMTIIPFSALGDHVGQRRLYRAGLVIYVLSAFLCLLATGLSVILAIRTVQALSSAAAFSVTFGLIRSTYPARLLGRGLGINTLFSASGNALAPALGGLILSIASWRWVFVAGVPLALVSLLAGRNLPDVRVEKKRFDAFGAALCASAFALVILGLEAISHSADLPKPLLLLGAGVVTAYVFVNHQRRQRDPVLPLDLLTRPAFALAVSGSLMGAVASATILFSLPFRLHEHGFSPAETGAMITPYAIASLMIAPASGILSDHVSPKLLGMCGLVVATLAMLLIAFMPAHPEYWDIVWRVWLCGAGFAMFLAPNSRIVLASTPADRAAAGGGLMTTSRMLGNALAATLVGCLLAIGHGPGPAPALIAVGLAVVAMLCNLLQPYDGTAAGATAATKRAAEG